MDMQLKKQFMELWKKYFDGAELPITFYYSDNTGDIEVVKKPSDHACVISVLNKARKGKQLCFDMDSIGCPGGKRYLGYLDKLMPNFEYFLSCGIPGEMEGERYKKSPEIVREIMKNMPAFKAPAKYLIFKRWDSLNEDDNPDVVIFYALPEILSGLFTLAGFDEAESNSVIAPFSSGCGSIVMHPYLENERTRPRCILGMFDVSARPFVPSGILTFSAPMKKFQTMVRNMGESFLITPSWNKVRSRIARSNR
jgi:uncharacterized protein (DUF169 family)